MVSVYTYPEPEFNRREILRYAGGGKSSYEVNQLMESCISELGGKLAYRVCSCRFPIKRENDALDLGFANVKSDGLTRNLKGCDEIVLFAATIGIEIDRLIITIPYRGLAPYLQIKQLIFHIYLTDIIHLQIVFVKELLFIKFIPYIAKRTLRLYFVIKSLFLPVSAS